MNELPPPVRLLAQRILDEAAARLLAEQMAAARARIDGDADDDQDGDEEP